MRTTVAAKRKSEMDRATGLLTSLAGVGPANGADEYVPLRDRFKAWWSGEEMPAGARPTSSDNKMAIDLDDDDEDDAGSIDDSPWGATRLGLIQSIWGEGFIEPGGAKFTKKLLGWLALNSRQSVLDLSAGLGGTARSVASAHNLWMEALEPVQALASEGRRQSVVAGLGRQVPIALADLETHKLPKRRYDAIYSRERLFTVRNKAALLGRCAEALKPKGQILITDYMRSADIGGAELAERWGRHEKSMPTPWTLKAYRESLAELDLNVLIAQDISEEMVENINWAWRRVPKLLSEGNFSRRQITHLVREGEIWLDRLRAIQRGHLIVGRLHAQNVKS